MFRKPIQKVDFNEMIRELITTVECYNESNRTHGNGDFRLVNEEKELLIKSDDRKYLLKISVQDIKSINEIDNDSAPDMEWEYD